MARPINKIQKITILRIIGLGSVILLGLVLYGLSKLSYDYDPDRAAQYATDNANKKSVSLCAAYVRNSLEAGGCPTFFHPKVAYEYKDFLLDLGFIEIPKTNKREIGDIVVFNAVRNHPYGHIAIWNGNQWISDFKQRNLFVAKEYSSKDATYFRLTKGKHRRQLLPTRSYRKFLSKIKRKLS